MGKDAGITTTDASMAWPHAGRLALAATRISWWCSLSLFPLLLLQAAYVRRRVPRLPEAAGGPVGECPGASPPLRVLIAGESSAAGVGATTHEEALAGQLSCLLARATGRQIRWRVVGRNGATTRALTRMLTDQVDVCCSADLVVLALGVNDVLTLRSSRQFASDLRELITVLRRGGADPGLLLSAVPPLEQCPGVPQPLRAVLGLRARLLDQTARQVAQADRRAAYAPAPRLLGRHFCCDGFHPSTAGYHHWATSLRDPALGLLPINGGRRHERRTAERSAAASLARWLPVADSACIRKHG